MYKLLVLFGAIAASSAALLHPVRIHHQFPNTIDLEAIRQGRADAGNMLDQILATVREQMGYNGFNKIGLPDEYFHFEKEILGVIWHGEANLTVGSLENMDTIHRTGPADVVTEENGDMVVSADVGVNRGKLNYNLDVSFMDLGPHTEVHGTLSRVRVLLEVRITKDMNITLEKFDIKDTGLLTVSIDGLGAVLDFLVEMIAVLLGNLVKGIVATLLESTIKDLVNDIISSILFPPSLAVAGRAAASVASQFIL